MTWRLQDGVAYEQVWDYENRLASVTDHATGQTTTFTYDGHGALVKKVAGGVTTIYIGAHYEKNITTGVATGYYYAGGRRVAMRQGGVVYYLLTDHLGSTALTVSSGGVKVAELRYKAWGETRTSAGSTPTDYRWTGQRQEESLGLYQMGARWVDPALSRWLSADTLVPGTAASSGGGAATLGYDDQVRLTPLTVGFHETQFLSVVGEENREIAARGFWFQRSEEEKGRSRYQWGPINPQALNRYAHGSLKSGLVSGIEVNSRYERETDCDE